MANLTPEPDTQDLLKRNVLGPAIFVLGAFVAVMMALDWYIGAGTGIVGDLARSIRNTIGGLPALLAGAGTAWAGARLFLQTDPDDTLHHLAGWILVSLALSLVLAPINSEWGGTIGFTKNFKVLGFFLGLAALFAPVWFFWLRDRFVLPDESEMPESLSQTLLDEGGAGISAEEADALLPMDDDSYQPARQNPELAALLAESLAGAAASKAIETKAPSPYPDDVRKSGGIPVGAVPIEAPAEDADGNIAFAAGVETQEGSQDSNPVKGDSEGSESVHRWTPKERRLAGQTLGEEAQGEESKEVAKAPRKLQVKHSGPAQTADTAASAQTAMPLDVRPIEDMVDIPPRPIWEAEEAGDDTAGAIADALFGDGPIGPVRTLPHDAPGAAQTIAADAERVPEFSLEAPEVEDEEELAEWDGEEDDELEEDEGEFAEADEYDEEEEDEDEEEYEDDEAAELEEDELDEEDAEEEEYEDDEAAELEEDEADEDEEDEEEYEDEEAAELEDEDEDDDEEEEYEDEAAELEEEDEYEDDEEEEYEEAAELEDEDDLEEDELEEAAELEEEEPEEENEEVEAAELEAAEALEEVSEEIEEKPVRSESEVVLTPKAPPTPERAASPPVIDMDMGVGRVSPEIVYDAGVLFLERGRVAVSLLQREFSLDFDESCEVMDRLQKLGLIGPYVGGHRRDILLSREEWLEKATVG